VIKTERIPKDPEADATGFNVFDLIGDSRVARRLLAMDSLRQFNRDVPYIPEEGDVPFHSFDKFPSRHIIRTLYWTTEFANAERLPPDMRRNMRSAALLHDWALPQGRTDHEDVSADWAVRFMNALGAPKRDRAMVHNLILATKGTHEGNRYITTPKTRAQAVLCDADGAYVLLPYRHYTLINDRLRVEEGVRDPVIWRLGELLYLDNKTFITLYPARQWQTKKQPLIEAQFASIPEFLANRRRLRQQAGNSHT